MWLHLEHVDGELQHRQVVGVLRRGEIGDVAVDEQLAGIEIDDLVGRHAAVGAADPQIFRRLLARQPAEEIGVAGDLAGGPGAVVVFEVVEHRLPALRFGDLKVRPPVHAGGIEPDQGSRAAARIVRRNEAGELSPASPPSCS